MKKPVIYDGDMGGDDLWAIAMLLANRDTFDILGIASVFGNVSQPQATKNALNFLHWMKCDDLEIVQGADMPCDGMRPFGDDAYGENGVGGYILPESPIPVTKTDIAAWYNTRLHAASAPVTIFATGPATNLALLIQQHPERIEKIERIIFMGGAINAPGKDGRPVILDNGMVRIGNITPYAEFNAYQDPNALNILIESGVRIEFMAADASQNMVLTPERQAKIIALHHAYGPAFHRMLMAVEHLDRTKFGVDGPFIHDPNVAIYAIAPELYKTRPLPKLRFTEATPDNDRRGQAVETGANGNVLWLTGVTDAEAVFEKMVESLSAAIAQAS